MKNPLKSIPLLILGLILTASLSFAQSASSAAAFTSSTGTTTVTVTIGPQAGLKITTGSTPLTLTGSNFTGSTALTYFVRTTTTGGGGSITLEVTSDFACGGGPCVATPPNTGDALTYTCTVAGPGTPCTGTQTASTTATTNVATFATNVHTGPGGSTASINWTLTNDPTYKTGTYNATVTFTISAS